MFIIFLLQEYIFTNYLNIQPVLAYLFQLAQSNFGAKHLLHTIPEASDDDKLAEFGQNPAEFDDNDDIILLYLEMCLIM